MKWSQTLRDAIGRTDCNKKTHPRFIRKRSNTHQKIFDFTLTQVNCRNMIIGLKDEIHSHVLTVLESFVVNKIECIDYES